MSAVRKRECGINEEENELRRGPWTLEEDSLLIQYIARHGEGRWNMSAKSAGLKRTGKSCRLRWLNYLKPDIKRGNLTPQEQLLILELHAKWGNRWSKIAQHMPGRTDNEIKNYWRTRVQKQAKQLNIESGSKRFIEAVRCFWMPRLLQKMEQNSSSSSHSAMKSMNFENSAKTSMPNTASPVPTLSPPLPLQREFIDASSYSSSVSNISNPSTDSLQFSQMLEISEHQTSPYYPHVYENNYVCSNPIQDGWYVNGNSFGMEGLKLEEPQSMMETYDFSQFDFHNAETDWVFGNMGDILWNMD